MIFMALGIQNKSVIAKASPEYEKYALVAGLQPWPWEHQSIDNNPIFYSMATQISAHVSILPPVNLGLPYMIWTTIWNINFTCKWSISNYWLVWAMSH